MKMFIANCTNQVQDFQYVLPETRGAPRKQTIEVGGQIQVSGDLNTPQIEAIIQQHAPYGMRSEDEVKRERDFVGLIYSLDKPVNMNAVRLALQQNQGVLDVRGQRIRQEAAVAVNNQIEENTGPSRLNALELTITEEKPRDDKLADNTGHTPMAEAIRVTRNEGGEPGRPTRKASAQGRAPRTRKAA